ncbi:phosphoribosyltransferase [Tropicimonas marinistellae]|uniref:phosphoribosyltransferase n=1 Tax=Tropicimonas marinistellae TaxID=1739787 RepID=UPI000835415F|nr:phosphoribosyltransferase [Tropicimonas marinistellae]
MRTDVWQHLHRDLTPGVQRDQETFAAPLGKRQLLLPIRALSDGARGVASLIVNQASFEVLDALADCLADRLKPYDPDIVVAVPTLGLALGEAVARRLDHARMVPLGTSRKFWYDDTLSVPLTSITSPTDGKRLYADPRMLPLLKGARVALVDDVVSTGSSMVAALHLMTLIGVSPAVIGAAMLQGEAWRDKLGAIPVEGAFRTPILRHNGDSWEAP